MAERNAAVASDQQINFRIGINVGTSLSTAMTSMVTG
jgi:hypothetical protein